MLYLGGSLVSPCLEFFGYLVFGFLDIKNTNLVIYFRLHLGLRYSTQILIAMEAYVWIFLKNSGAQH
jgi:hypothetical protein